MLFRSSRLLDDSTLPPRHVLSRSNDGDPGPRRALLLVKRHMGVYDTYVSYTLRGPKVNPPRQNSKISKQLFSSRAKRRELCAAIVRRAPAIAASAPIRGAQNADFCTDTLGPSLALPKRSSRFSEPTRVSSKRRTAKVRAHTHFLERCVTFWMGLRK